MLALAAAMFSMFFFLTLYVQNVLGYSPLKAGFAFLPVSAVIVVTASIASSRLLKTGPKPFMLAGSILATVGLAWLSRISADSTYVGGILGPMILFAAGMGFLFVPLTITAVNGVDNRESGAASGLLNVMQQVGGSLGLSILVTVFGTAQRDKAEELARSRQLGPDAQALILAHGISRAFVVAVVFAAIALTVTVFAIRATASDVDPNAVPGMAA
jgi:Na+/melibiose symporter-like transporter